MLVNMHLVFLIIINYYSSYFVAKKRIYSSATSQNRSQTIVSDWSLCHTRPHGSSIVLDWFHKLPWYLFPHLFFFSEIICLLLLISYGFSNQQNSNSYQKKKRIQIETKKQSWIQGASPTFSSRNNFRNNPIFKLANK